MGNFNAQIGPDRTGFENVMGKEALGQRTGNGERLLIACSNNELKVGGSICAHRRIHKGTWRSADSSSVNQIDHICISRRWISALQDVWVYRGADVATDHYLLVAKLKMKLKCRSKKGIASQTFDVTKLRQSDVRTAFELEVSNRFAVLEASDDVEKAWNNFKDTVSAAAKKVIGH